MMKHTPAPWLIDDESFVYGLNAQGYNRFHAHVQGGNTAPMEKTTAAEIRANARLIAAAPELLEALKDCREALRRSGAAGELAVVDAAIAKAT